MKKLLISVAAAVLLAAVGFSLLILYEEEWKITDRGTEVSPDGQYRVCFQSVGTPAWPFGPDTVRITVTNREGDRIFRTETAVGTDGGAVSEHYWTVKWEEDRVTVILRGERPVQTIEIFLNE